MCYNKGRVKDMNKGFTLIELIGTVVILAMLSLLALPAILNVLDNSNKKVDTETQNFLKSAASSYFNDHKDDTNIESVEVKTLMEEGYISTTIVCNDCELANDTISINGTYTPNDETATCPEHCSTSEDGA